ncbi:MAG: 2'-5' RNA ligase family protein [Bdellovibrionales bacterium]|nr:2'-5' RNA ligase family protein [Bdellovibrionales bacterium]
MNTKYFLGLTFYPDNSFSKNIESFRSRFDTKYQTNPYLHLAIVPPFEVEVTETKELKQELIEELESFFFENTANHVMKFSGMDVHEYKKNKILYLNPVFENEFALCQESLFAICQSYVADREKKMKDSKKTFLTIGRYQDCLDLHSSIEMAKNEFQEFTSLAFQSICLFSKSNGIWYREADLVSFEKPDATFLQSTPVSV